MSGLYELLQAISMVTITDVIALYAAVLDGLISEHSLSHDLHFKNGPKYFKHILTNANGLVICKDSNNTSGSINNTHTLQCFEPKAVS